MAWPQILHLQLFCPLDASSAATQLEVRRMPVSGSGRSRGRRSLGAPLYPRCSTEDVAMRTAYDFSPLSRSSIGFDPLFNLLENAARVPATETWPPYDIGKAGQDQYRITMAVAGFSPQDLNLTTEPDLLIVSGRMPADEDVQHLHRGIPASSFERRFELADYVQVQSARLENGLLTIELVREIPEEMKPRRIEVQAPKAPGTGEPAPRQVEHRKEAA